MSRRYSLETKLDALNQLDQHDGDAALVSDVLEIPLATLRSWLAKESELRRAYDLRRQRQYEGLKRELQSDIVAARQSHLVTAGCRAPGESAAQQLAAALAAW